MKKVLLLMLAFVCLTSCENKKKEEPKEIIDVTLRKPDGDPVGTHRDANGNIWSDHDIFAPREGETVEDFKERTGSDDGGGSNPYEEGYEDGYEEGYEAGKAENN